MKRPPAIAVALLLGTGWLLAGNEEQPDPILAESLAQKLQTLQDRQRQEGVEPIELEVTEEEANSYVRYRLRDRLPEGVTEPWLRFRGGPIDAGVVLDLAVLQSRMPESPWVHLFSGRVPVELQATIHAEDGQGRLEIESVTVSGVPVPNLVIRELMAAFTKSPERPDGVEIDGAFSLPYGIESARVTEGRLLLRQGGRTRPGKGR